MIYKEIDNTDPWLTILKQIRKHYTNFIIYEAAAFYCPYIPLTISGINKLDVNIKNFINTHYGTLNSFVTVYKP